MSEVHQVYYTDETVVRRYWECQTCSSSGSVGEWGDPEVAAERFHQEKGITITTVNKRLHE